PSSATGAAQHLVGINVYFSGWTLFGTPDVTPWERVTGGGLRRKASFFFFLPGVWGGGEGGKAGGGLTSFGTKLMKNKGAKQKLKRKGAASAFGCDLTEYLESSGQD
ncbi:Rho GTPase-activating protein 31, partial [Struthio camelus australis]